MANSSQPPGTPEAPLTRRTVALFGCGARGLQCLAALKDDPRLHIAGFFDNDATKWGTSVQGLPVFEPTAERCLEMDAILLASVYARDILAQLTRLGVAHKAVLSPPQLTRRLTAGTPVGSDDDRALSPADRRARMLDLAPAEIRNLAARIDHDPPPVGPPSGAWSGEVACTICCNNYFAYATVLARSFLRHHPGGRFFICLVDAPHDAVAYPTDSRVTVLTAASLGIPAFETLAFKYDVLEFNTAVKPFLLERLFRQHDVDRLLYLDPDVFVTASLDPLFDALGETPLLLTPHLRRPYTDDHSPGEIDIMRAGTFNLGFAALAAHPQTWELLTWWQARLTDGCTREVEKGYFVDQKWMDFVPSFFPDHRVLRDAGYNAAYWNLHERTLSRDGDTFLVDGAPLRFFHFSGIDVHDLESVSKHQTRWTLPDTGALRDLFELYRVLLVSHGQLELKATPYTYGAFANGVRVPDLVRRVYRDARLQHVYPAPFAAGDGSFFTWLRTPWAAGSLLTNLAASLRARAGLPPAADVADDEISALLQWHLDAERHTLPPELVDALPAVVVAPRAPAMLVSRHATPPPPAVVTGPRVGDVPEIVMAALDAAWTRARSAASSSGRPDPAYWLWDDTWHIAPAVAPGREIWVPSSYSLEGAARVAAAPVVLMPLASGVTAPSALSRDGCGVPGHTRLVLTIVDTVTAGAQDLAAMMASVARGTAGPTAPAAHLVIGVTSTALAEVVRRAVQAQGLDVTAVDVQQRPVADLVQLTRLADVYLSLGGDSSTDPWMAEALWAGCPAVTTGRGGMRDLATVNNSYLVGMTTAGSPDVDHAAHTLAQALTADADRVLRGARARRDLVASHALEAVAARMARRLTQRVAHGTNTGTAA